MLVDYPAINIRSISDLKWGYVKANAFEGYKRDLRQVISLRNLKYRSLALEGFVKDETDLVLVNNLLAD